MCKMFTQSEITAIKLRTSSSSIENVQKRLHRLLHITGGPGAISVTQLPQRQVPFPSPAGKPSKLSASVPWGFFGTVYTENVTV